MGLLDVQCLDQEESPGPNQRRIFGQESGWSGAGKSLFLPGMVDNPFSVYQSILRTPKSGSCATFLVRVFTISIFEVSQKFFGSNDPCVNLALWDTPDWHIIFEKQC